MVDDRRAAILRAIVRQYIETSQPVSSAHVAEEGSIRASSATVRAEMAALERDGYLVQPHTSAGRIPTDQGYRFFVDQLRAPSRLTVEHQQDVKQFFAEASGELENMLHSTGLLLTKLTGAAAVVVGPDHESITVRSAQLVSLNPKIILVVLVFSNGVVDKATIELPGEVSDAVVSMASGRLQALLSGKTLESASNFDATGNKEVDDLLNVALRAISPTKKDNENVYVGGASQVANSFEAVETVRQVLTILEQQYVVVSLIRDLLDRGMKVSIGAENNMQPLAHCALVVAPTIVDGEQRGSVAILGPTRMDYAHAMAAVSIVSRKLGDKLSEK